MIRDYRNILIAALVCLFTFTGATGTAHAQGSRKDDVVFNAQGRPLAGATVRVCTSAATGQPCSPLASVYSDAALTQALANPLAADGLGNYSFYATPGRYMIELSGPGITTKQLPNVILPSDPSSPTFTTVTTTSGISAFSLSLSGNLTVSGSTSVTGSLTVGGAPVPSTTADNQWTTNQRFKGPIPYRDTTAYGAISSTQTFTAACTSSLPNVTLNTAGDWANGQTISIEGCGAASTAAAPVLTGLAISAISRTGNVVTATVSSAATVAVNQFIQVAGVTNSTFNGVFFTQTSSGTTITWNQTATNASSSGGTVSPGAALYEGTNPGSTTHSYNVCSMDTGGGCSAKSATLTVSNSPTTLTSLDYIWLYFGIPTGTGFPVNVDYYCVYRDNAFIGRAHVPGFKDDGTTWARNTNCPSTAPSSATADTLTTTVSSGAGTTSLVLAASAGTSGSGLFTFHDAAPAINAAFADVIADGGGKPNVILPAGSYYVSRLVIDTYDLEATGQINLTTHPIRVQNGGTFNGHGAFLVQAVNYSQDNQVRITSGNMDGIVIAGSVGGNTVRGVEFPSTVTHDIILAANGFAGANGVTIEHVSGSHAVAGDCLWAESNTIFVRIKDFRCAAATIAQGGSANRYSMYLTNVWAAGSWVDWDLEDIFFDFGDIYVDSPAPSLLGGGASQFREVTIKRYKSEGGLSKGFLTLDSGCQQSPVNNAVVLSYPHFEDFGPSDRTAFNGFYYYPRVGTTGCMNPQISDSNTIFANMQGADPLIGANGPLTNGDYSVGHDVKIGPADASLLPGATRIGTGRTIVGRQFYTSYPSVGLGDQPSSAYLMTPPAFYLTDDGAGGTCGASTTYYFRVSMSDGQGWTKVGDNTVEEQSFATGAGGHLIGVYYGTNEGFGILGAKYRIWYGTSSGVENNYFETTDQGHFSFTCAAGTSGAMPTATTAYWMKVPSQTADPGWWGISASDKTGFGKVNPAYSVDSSGTINADVALRLNAKLLASATAPTIASGFGTSPSIPSSNGSAVFTVNVGTGGSATSGVITMPAAPTGWNCFVNDITAAAAHVAYNTRQTASSTTSVTVENQTTSTGAAVAWGAGDILRMICGPY